MLNGEPFQRIGAMDLRGAVVSGSRTAHFHRRMFPTAGGRRLIDGDRPTSWDFVGAAIAVTGMVVIMLAPRHA